MIIKIEINDCFKHIPFGVFNDECNFTLFYNCNFPIKEDKVNDFVNIIKSNHTIVEILAILNRCDGDFKSYLDEVIAVAIDGMGDIDIAKCFESDEDDFDASWWEQQAY